MNLKKLFLTVLLSSISSAPLMGQEDSIKIEKVLQITDSKKNGEVGKASYYGGKHNGRKTASGKIFDKNALTCAHMTLPFGTKIRVTNINTGKSVIVEVTDRGNFGKYGRVVDLSEGAFKKIASLKQGVVKVKVEKL